MLDRASQSTMLYSLLLCAWVMVFADAIGSAVNIWYTSEIFTHGFFIIPGALGIIWTKRQLLMSQEFKPNYWVAFLLIPTLFLGIVGAVGDINLFQHIACFASLPLAIWFMIGNRAARIIWFPLSLMLFAIPIGEELVPLLQQWTAKLAVYLLGFTSIPVYVEGLFINIPQGSFIVAEACSGIRFFVGAIVFGFVYSYYSFNGLAFRIGYLSLSIVLPVIANALRVFGLVLIGHYFGMEHASGTDHLIYGWIFFAIVLGLLFCAGEFLRAFERKETIVSSKNTKNYLDVSKPAFLCVLLLICGAALWANSLRLTEASNTQLLTNSFGMYSSLKKGSDGWQPTMFGASDQAVWRLPNNVQVQIFWYANDIGDTELTSYKNQLFDKSNWSIVSQNIARVGPQKVVKTVVTSLQGRKQLLYSWYQLSDKVHTSKTYTKISQTMERMFGGVGAGAWVSISIPFSTGELSKADEHLSNAYAAHHENIIKALPF